MVNTKQRVKVLKGLFKGLIGEVHSKVTQSGKELYVVKFNKFIEKQTGQRKPGWTTVTIDEMEFTEQPETFREV